MKRNKDRNITAIPTAPFPHYLAIAPIIIAGFLAYHRSILNGVFLFDDNALILENPLIKDLSHIKDIFTTHLFYGSGVYSNFYRPMQSLLLMLDYHFWVLNPFGYHLSNVLIHIFNAVLVYLFIYIVSKRQTVALMAGLLFCVHTVLSGPVNYISAKADLLSAFFFLAGVIFYVLYRDIYMKRHRIFLYLFSIACFILALLSKEVAIIFPFIILLYLFCFSKNRGPSGKKAAPDLIWIFFIIALIYISLRATFLNFTEGRLLETTTGQLPLYIRLLTSSKVLMIYLRLLLFPVGLHMEWNIEPAVSFLQDEVFLSAVGLFIIACFSYFLLRTSKSKFFCTGWFFITLLPYSNIFPLAYFMGEGWLYLPSIGFFALLALYLSELASRSRLWASVVVCMTVSLTVCYGILTFRRAEVWADPAKLYAEVLRYSPNNPKARINLGVVLAKSGLAEEAIARYKEAALLAPDDAGVHANLGTVYADKKMYDMALMEFQKAVESNPEDYVAHNNIGIIYKMKGDIKKALEEYKKALEINPNYSLTYNNVGNVYLDSGDYDRAIRFYKKAIRLDPNRAASYANLGKAYKNRGLPQKARESFEEALRLDPGDKDAIEGLNLLN